MPVCPGVFHEFASRTFSRQPGFFLMYAVGSPSFRCPGNESFDFRMAGRSSLFQDRSDLYLSHATQGFLAHSPDVGPGPAWCSGACPEVQSTQGGSSLLSRRPRRFAQERVMRSRRVLFIPRQSGPFSSVRNCFPVSLGRLGSSLFQDRSGICLPQTTQGYLAACPDAGHA